MWWSPPKNFLPKMGRKLRGENMGSSKNQICPSALSYIFHFPFLLFYFIFKLFELTLLFFFCFFFKLQALSLCCFFFSKLQSLSLRSFFFFFGELQITPLKFGGDWILHLEVSKFRFYPLKFGVFGFYTLTSQILDFTP